MLCIHSLHCHASLVKMLMHWSKMNQVILQANVIKFIQICILWFGVYLIKLWPITNSTVKFDDNTMKHY